VTTCFLTRSAAGRGTSGVVDIYNSVTGAWSTAVLSVARFALAAASVGNVALFAGGTTGGALLCKEHVWRSWVECLRAPQCVALFFSPASTCCLIRSAADPPIAFNVVDIYNVITGSWSTAVLSVARYGLTATSVGNVALFAGGIDGAGALLCSDYVWYLWLHGGLLLIVCERLGIARLQYFYYVRVRAPVPINSLFCILVDQPVVDIYTAAPAPSTSAPATAAPTTAAPTTAAPTTLPSAPSSVSSDTTARLLPPGAIAGIVIVILVAVFIHALFFMRTKSLSIGNNRGRLWFNAALACGPVVWLMWWCKHRSASDTGAAQHLMA
jgi:hypothetical protein